jgi:hypothetical protein
VAKKQVGERFRVVIGPSSAGKRYFKELKTVQAVEIYGGVRK